MIRVRAGNINRADMENTELSYNCHEAELDSLRLPLRIIDSDKYRAEGAKPTLILKRIYQEFHIKRP